ncbi:MAG: preprotein translocase subunit SecG [Lachnospiraceae bacterium]|nr:preprotein translocase subunit SecG [Lachnospiraceae bacterium]
MRIFFTIMFVLVCIAAVILVLLQEGKNAGLGAIAGADSYWGKNKGRSMEGNLVKWTIIIVVAFFVLAIILNLNF